MDILPSVRLSYNIFMNFDAEEQTVEVGIIGQKVLQHAAVF